MMYPSLLMVIGCCFMVSDAFVNGVHEDALVNSLFDEYSHAKIWLPSMLGKMVYWIDLLKSCIRRNSDLSRVLVLSEENWINLKSIVRDHQIMSRSGKNSLFPFWTNKLSQSWTGSIFLSLSEVAERVELIRMTMVGLETVHLQCGESSSSTITGGTLAYGDLLTKAHNTRVAVMELSQAPLSAYFDSRSVPFTDEKVHDSVRLIVDLIDSLRNNPSLFRRVSPVSIAGLDIIRELDMLLSSFDIEDDQFDSWKVSFSLQEEIVNYSNNNFEYRFFALRELFRKRARISLKFSERRIPFREDEISTSLLYRMDESQDLALLACVDTTLFSYENDYVDLMRAIGAIKLAKDEGAMNRKEGSARSLTSFVVEGYLLFCKLSDLLRTSTFGSGKIPSEEEVLVFEFFMSIRERFTAKMFRLMLERVDGLTFVSLEWAKVLTEGRTGDIDQESSVSTRKRIGNFFYDLADSFGAISSDIQSALQWRLRPIKSPSYSQAMALSMPSEDAVKLGFMSAFSESNFLHSFVSMGSSWTGLTAWKDEISKICVLLEYIIIYEETLETASLQWILVIPRSHHPLGSIIADVFNEEVSDFNSLPHDLSNAPNRLPFVGIVGANLPSFIDRSKKTFQDILASIRNHSLMVSKILELDANKKAHWERVMTAINHEAIEASRLLEDLNSIQPDLLLFTVILIRLRNLQLYLFDWKKEVFFLSNLSRLLASVIEPAIYFIQSENHVSVALKVGLIDTTQARLLPRRVLNYQERKALENLFNCLD